MQSILIQTATEAHLPAITEIYNQAILTTTATFDTEEKTLENRLDWLQNRNSNFPILVLLKDEKVVGYIALNKWSERKAYDITAEISLYILENERGNGYGKMLLNEMIQVAKKTELTSLLARITTENKQSIFMHTQVGFVVVGIMQKVGEKFGKKLDVTMLQMMLK